LQFRSIILLPEATKNMTSPTFLLATHYYKNFRFYNIYSRS
jgi:hypothetical protein